jgi:hypothetical protein
MVDTPTAHARPKKGKGVRGVGFVITGVGFAIAFIQ